jgi:hypothetical protein
MSPARTKKAPARKAASRPKARGTAKRR